MKTVNGYQALLELQNDIALMISSLSHFNINVTELQRNEAAMKDYNEIVLDTVDEIYADFKDKFKKDA